MRPPVLRVESIETIGGTGYRMRADDRRADA